MRLAAAFHVRAHRAVRPARIPRGRRNRWSMYRPSSVCGCQRVARSRSHIVQSRACRIITPRKVCVRMKIRSCTTCRARVYPAASEETRRDAWRPVAVNRSPTNPGNRRHTRSAASTRRRSDTDAAIAPTVDRVAPVRTFVRPSICIARTNSPPVPRSPPSSSLTFFPLPFCRRYFETATKRKFNTTAAGAVTPAGLSRTSVSPYLRLYFLRYLRTYMFIYVYTYASVYVCTYIYMRPRI